MVFTKAVIFTDSAFMLDSDKKYVEILLDVLQEKGVKDVVCSPGSRNAPLLIGIASRVAFNKHMAIDERSGAFLALGIASVSRKPVALICTSGTALLNYSPAVAEAYYQGVPLIVISADRPQQWVDQDDSQTLRQFEALANFVKGSYNIPAYGEENPEMQWYVNRIANEAFISATSGKPGPVHINIALSEPLGHRRTHEAVSQRLIDFMSADSIGNKERIKDLAQRLSHAKVLLVAGFMPPDADLQKAVATFSRFPNVAVMAETLSNLHLDACSHSIDSTLTALHEDELDKLAPEIVISIGGALVSRKLKEYLRKHASAVKHWSVGYSNTFSDPFMSLSLRLELDPCRFFRNINGALKKLKPSENTCSYNALWQEAKTKALNAKEKYILNCPWSELTAFSYILPHLPADCNLFLSNGTAVRYAQLINYKLPHACYCNRGVSGIDGSISTSIGGAGAYKKPTVIITGDLSLAYDIGSLGIDGIPDNFKIIVIDNQGGGIFRFIPSTSALELREEYFCVNPHLPLQQLAGAYGWQYLEASDIDSLRKSVDDLMKSSCKSMLKVVCDGERSAGILKEYMNIKI